MKIKLPIILVDEKEMWEREEAEFLNAQNESSLKDLGISPNNDSPVPFEHSKDRQAPFVLDFANVHLFYQTFMHFNDQEVEGVRVRLHDGYWPPIFIIPFATFEKLYIKFHKGELFKREDDVVLSWEQALEI